jgi:monoterpene epsilon-lactone hydrolase
MLSQLLLHTLNWQAVQLAISATLALAALSGSPFLQASDSVEATQWRAHQQQREQAALDRQAEFVAALKPQVTEANLGGVPVLWVKPPNWTDKGKLVVYTHGGGYVMLSARSTLASSALVAHRSGLQVLAVDYTLAPHSRWRETTGQVVAVFEALLKQGYAPADIALYGDSAGGGLAAGSVLRMRDLGLGMPAALVLWSPWSDLTDDADNGACHLEREPEGQPGLNPAYLRRAAAAYADPDDQKHPWASPVYGDYATGFPPTLIQGGTAEGLLDTFVRHYQALDSGGQPVWLDLYPGAVHVFQVQRAGSPQAEMALDKSVAFMRRHLGVRQDDTGR